MFGILFWSFLGVCDAEEWEKNRLLKHIVLTLSVKTIAVYAEKSAKFLVEDQNCLERPDIGVVLRVSFYMALPSRPRGKQKVTTHHRKIPVVAPVKIHLFLFPKKILSFFPDRIHLRLC